MSQNNNSSKQQNKQQDQITDPHSHVVSIRQHSVINKSESIKSAVNAAKEYLKRRDEARRQECNDEDETTEEYDVVSSSHVDDDDDDDDNNNDDNNDSNHDTSSSSSDDGDEHNDDDEEDSTVDDGIDSRSSGRSRSRSFSGSRRRSSGSSSSSSNSSRRHRDNDSYHNRDDMTDDYDPEAEDYDSNELEASEVFSKLNQLISRAYKVESSKIDKPKLPYQQISIHDFKFQKLNNNYNDNNHMIQPETSMLELVTAWKTLLDQLTEAQIFLEYVHHLEDAFQLTGNLCIDNTQRKEYNSDENDDNDDPLITRNDEDIRRKIVTLIVLLQRCVEQHSVDQSIPCRFLTILEVILSYSPYWKPSEQVIRLWIRLMQRIPNDIPAINFRRKAYRVIVSLSWVPSSKGLMEACSFEHMIRPIDFTKSDIQPSIRSHMARIKNGNPLPRYDCVNQLLDRLKDETDVCVAITSLCDGMGKTTIAGQVASHPSIQRVFYVLWLRLSTSTSSTTPTSHASDEVMTYDRYITFLNELCSQLPSENTDLNNIPINTKNRSNSKKNKKMIRPSWPKYIQRFEEKSIRKLREHDCIIEAKELMTDILYKQERNILLVLDDISDPSMIEYFRFFDRQSIILTTSKIYKFVDIVDWSIQLAAMSVEEAIELFLQEAGLPTNHIIGCTKEVLMIIRKTKCHPLFVRTIARWYQMKYEASNRNLISAMDEILEELNLLDTLHNKLKYNSTSNDKNEERPDYFLFEALQLMMQQPTSTPGEVKRIRIPQIFALCFAIMVVVFDDGCPLDSVLLLWDQILKSEPVAMEGLKKIAATNNKKGNDANITNDAAMTDFEIRNHGRYIAMQLCHIGLISIVEVNNNPWVHVHHQLYRHFATIIVQQRLIQFKHNDYDEAVAGWNHAFVIAYFRKRIQCDKKDFDDNSWDYSIQKLPAHMFQGKMISTAIQVLADETFFQARIEAMGWDRGIEQHIRDCISLQHELDRNTTNTATGKEMNGQQMKSASTIFNRTAEMINILADELDLSDDEITVRESRALYRLGFALTENGYYIDAIEHFENAQQLNPRSRTLKASILYSAGWALLANNEPVKAKKKINASRKMMDQGSDLHELYKEMLLVYAEALVATCDYKEASSFYEVIVDNMRLDKECNPIELGTALYRKGCLDYVMGDLERAKITLDECIKWKMEIKETSESLASAHALYGDIYLQLDKRIEAKKCYEASIQILKQLNCDMQKLGYQVLKCKMLFLRNEFGGSRHIFDDTVRKIQDYPIMVLDRSAYDLRMISRIYSLSGDRATSISILQLCLKLTTDRPLSIERSWIYMELGHRLIEESNVKEGLTCYEEALAIQIAKLGESQQIVETSKLIGNVHFSLGDYEASLSIFLKIHEIILRVSPDNIDKIAEILLLIGDTYVNREAYTEAEETYEECLEVLLKGRPPEHADIGKVNHRIGVAALKGNDLDVALKHFTEALRIRKMNFDERVVADTLQFLGTVYRKRKEMSSAKRSLLESLEIRKNLRMGKESCEAILELAQVYRILGDNSNASKLLAKGLELVDEMDVFSSRLNITFGHLKLAQSDYAAAESYYKVALVRREENYGKDHRLTGNAYRSLGIAYFMQAKTSLTYSNLCEYIRISDIYGEDCWETVDYVISTIIVGDINFSNGKQIEATISWTRAKELFVEAASIRTGLPSLEAMINRRLGDDGSIRDEKLATLPAEEIAIIQKILFIDD